MNISDILDKMIDVNASDIFIRTGSPLRGRISSYVETLGDEVFTKEEIEKAVKNLTGEREKENLKRDLSCEFAFYHKEHWRFRVGVFYQRESLAMVIRKIDLRVPTFEDLGLPAGVLERFCVERRGFVLLTGITGSGKSTTIASMIEYMNENYSKHILAIEEPIEFTFDDKKALINQREIGTDVLSYNDALRQFALHSPDVIYIGNIRDADTCHAALTAAETGVLVLSTIHTVNAPSTVERIINFFPPHQHHLVLNQLSSLLKGVISLRLVPKADGSGLVPAYEVMSLSPSVSRLIRENKIWEIYKYIEKGDVYGMTSFKQCLLKLVEEDAITADVALEYADKREELEMELRNKGFM
ncbi:MAG: PilT/PilU family type 4a pilus ATPase [Candidatus Omnitrophica bacterium]|nr:PilT/PilU family type 4a pilus ATPase [Candidatus Omnitrophota bacterium]